MTIVLGVDGGGTKTHALVVDTDGRVLGAGRSGPANWETVGLEGTAASLRSSVSRALEAAGAEPEAVVASAFGLGGIDWPDDVARVKPAIRRLALGGEVTIVNDAFVALRAGSEREDAVVVVAGTGTVCAGRNRKGSTFRTFGLGWMCGDYGSAGDIARTAVRAVAQAHLGAGPSTSLSERLCSLSGCSTVEELLEGLSRGRVRLPAAAPVVVEAAGQGDEAARQILIDAGRSLGECAALVARRLGIERGDFDVVLAGGVLSASSEPLERALEIRLRKVAPQATLVPLRAPPVCGAALMALDLVGARMEDDRRAALIAAAPAALAGEDLPDTGSVPA